ncbi:MAG: hypothetical protein JWQ36_3186 [Enterovirga sp.]|nr:hypothetical protein [Enterovirga sp.]
MQRGVAVLVTSSETGYASRGGRRRQQSLALMTPDKELKSGDVADRILESAELLLAQKGFGVSLREITAAAGVNLAAVNYYFGSKTKLLEGLFERLSERVNAQRVAELSRVLEDAGQLGQTPDLSEVIRVFVRPYLRPPAQGQLLARLILQHRVEPSDLTRAVIRRHFDPMAGLFIDALQRACPDLDQDTLQWRYVFMIGSIVLTATDAGPENRLSRISAGALSSDQRDSFETEIVSFLCGGVRGARETFSPNPMPFTAGAESRRLKASSPKRLRSGPD